MKLPPLELLKAVHSFPGQYTFKIIAQNDPTVAPSIVAKIKELCPRLTDLPYSSRTTENLKHLSITVEMIVETAEEIHAIYNGILSLPKIELML